MWCSYMICDVVMWEVTFSDWTLTYGIKCLTSTKAAQGCCSPMYTHTQTHIHTNTHTYIQTHTQHTHTNTHLQLQDEPPVEHTPIWQHMLSMCMTVPGHNWTHRYTHISASLRQTHMHTHKPLNKQLEQATQILEFKSPQNDWFPPEITEHSWRS